MMTCIDKRKCFARGCKGGCTILKTTYKKSGECPFCKRAANITKGKRYDNIYERGAWS